MSYELNNNNNSKFGSQVIVKEKLCVPPYFKYD